MQSAFEELAEKRKEVASGMKYVIIGAPCLLIPPIGIGLIFFGYYKVQKAQKGMKELYKEAFVREPLAKNFDDLVYQPTNGFTKETVEGFYLCRMGNRFYAEDYIRAAYNGVRFEVSDVTVREVDTSDNNSSSSTTYFKGRMMSFEFPKVTTSSVLLFSKSFAHRAINRKEAKEGKVSLESVVFNKDFDIYSPDPHSAFYLLTPQLMERLEALNAKYQSLAMHVYGNRVILAFNEPDNNAFDAKVDIGKLDMDAELAKVQSDIDDIKAFISAMQTANAPDFLMRQ